MRNVVLSFLSLLLLPVVVIAQPSRSPVPPITSHSTPPADFRGGIILWEVVDNEPECKDITLEFQVKQVWNSESSRATTGIPITIWDGAWNNLFGPATVTNTGLDVKGQAFTEIEYRVQHTFSEKYLKAFKNCTAAFFKDSSRINSVENDPGSDFFLLSSIDLNNNNRHASAPGIPFLVTLQHGVENVVPLAISDPDHMPMIHCGFSRELFTEVTEMPEAPSAGGHSMTVNPYDCTVHWDTSGTNPGELYVAQFAIRDWIQANSCLEHNSFEMLFQIEKENTPPTCTSSISGPVTVSAGEPFAASYVGADEDGGSLQMTAVTLPSGATVSPVSGSNQASPFSATVSWTPTVADEGQSFQVVLAFADSEGATATCETTLNVPVGPPECTSTDISGLLLALDGNAFAQRSLVSRGVAALRRTVSKSKRQQTKFKRTVRNWRSQALSLYESSWTNTYALPPQHIECTRAQGCVLRTFSTALTTYSANISAFDELLAKVLSRLKREAKKVGGKGGARGLRQAKSLTTAGLKQSDVTQRALRLAPTSSYSCP